MHTLQSTTLLRTILKQSWIFVFIFSFSTVLWAENKAKVPLRDIHVQPIPTEAGQSVLYFIHSRLAKLKTQEGESLEALREAVAQDPQSPYLHAELARYLAEANQFEQATLEADKALELAPNNPDFHLLRGKLHSVKGDPNLAHQSYERCIALAQETEECYTMGAREYILRKDIPKAKALLQKYLTQDPASVSALFLLAGLYTENSQEYPEAIKLLERSLEEDPKHISSLIALAEIYLKEKNSAKALETLLRFEHLVPNDVQTQLRIGLLYYENKEYAQAIQRFARVLQIEPKNDQVRYYLGLLEAQNKNYTQAVKYLSEISINSENYRQSLIERSWALGAAGQYQEALRTAKLALKKEKDNPEIYELLGTLYSKKHQYEKSLQFFTQGLKLRPDDEALLFGQGVVFDKMGKTEDSVKAMKKILAKNPKHAQALNFVGYTYAEKGIHLDEALTLLQQAHELRPEDGYITDSLGWAYFQKGDLVSAKKYLEKANEQSPGESSILEHLGDLYLKLGEAHTAKQYYQSAVVAAAEAKPQNEQEKKELKRIQEKLGVFSKK